MEAPENLIHGIDCTLYNMLGERSDRHHCASWLGLIQDITPFSALRQTGALPAPNHYIPQTCIQRGNETPWRITELVRMHRCEAQKFIRCLLSYDLQRNFLGILIKHRCWSARRGWGEGAGYSVAAGSWAALRVTESRVPILESPEVCLFLPQNNEIISSGLSQPPVEPKVADSTEDPARLRGAGVSVDWTDLISLGTNGTSLLSLGLSHNDMDSLGCAGKIQSSRKFSSCQ